MINADYFKTHIREQITELGSGSTTVEIRLHDGTAYSVRSLQKVMEGYVLLEVFPQEGVTEESKAQRTKVGGNDEVYYDRVALPYEIISHVILTIKKKKGRPLVGF